MTAPLVETREGRWAKRAAQNAAAEAYYAEQERAETERLAKIVAAAFCPLPVGLLVADGWTYTMDDLACIAVRALRDAGVIFASLGPCCDAHNDGHE